MNACLNIVLVTHVIALFIKTLFLIFLLLIVEGVYYRVAPLSISGRILLFLGLGFEVVGLPYILEIIS